MKKKLLLILGITFLSRVAHPTDDVHWSYVGADGPEHWGKLSPEFVMCAQGRNQSPINLSGFLEADLPELAFAYRPGGREVLNNGHTLQIDYAPGSTIVIDDVEFELKQFHFHAPSENVIEGKSYPMEAHLVHADRDKNLAVVAVLFEEGEANGLLEDLWKQMPKEAGGGRMLSAEVDASHLLPRVRDYYRFNGSLTTPPCSEGVRWVVMKDSLTVSRDQLQQFEGVMGHPNNRRCSRSMHVRYWSNLAIASSD